MEKKDWSTVHGIFSHAIDLPQHERTDYVRAATAELPDLQSAIFALLQADSDAGDYLEKPLISSGDLDGLHRDLTGGLQPGTVLAGRFEIVREVGVGGMGRVYEALDTEFHTRIAIKIIREELLSSPGALRRFRHEAQLARRLSHSGICRIHDLERATLPGAAGRELFFITMEFLDGTSLASELQQRGALPLDEVAAIARQTADALDAAHRGGVTHGDLKPANILLCRERDNLRVVVTDFGLARAHAAQTGRTGSGDTLSGTTLAAGPLGTLAYMAPEQIAGEAASPATDIYAYGLILYELLTGHRAFAEKNLLKGIADRLTAEPPSPRLERLGLSEGWSLAVEQCLHAATAERPSTAAAAVALATHSSSALRQRLHNVLRTSVRNHNTLAWTATLAVVLAVSLLAAFFRLEKTEASGPVQAGARIYMPPVRNFTGNPKLNGLTVMMHSALAQSPHVMLVSDAAAADTLQRMMRPANGDIDDVAARDIALRTRAERVVFVTLRGLNGKLHLSAEVQQPDTPARSRSSIRRSWTCCAERGTSNSTALVQKTEAEIPGDLLHIIRDAADWVRNNLGEPAETLRDLNEPVEDMTTMSWEALTEFTEAERLTRAGRQADAVTVLQQAVQHDPGFALAYARMGDLQFYLKRAAEGIQSYRHALATGSDRRLSRRERDRLRGLYAIDTWDYPTAESIFRDSTIYYDRDYLSRFYLGSVLFHLDRGAESIEQLSRAIALEPKRASGPFTLASVAFVEGDRKAALAQIPALRANGSHAEALWLEAEDAWLQGNAAAAEALVQQVRTVTESPFAALATMQLTRIAMQRNDPRQARATALEGIATAERRGNLDVAATHRMDLAAVACASSQHEECLREIRTSLQADSSPRNVRNGGGVLRDAISSASPAQRKQIATELRMMHATMPAEVYGTATELVKRELEGDLALAEGRTEAAIQSFRAVSVMDAPLEASLRLAHSLGTLGRPPGSATLTTGALTTVPINLRALRWYQCDDFSPQPGTLP